MITRTPVKSKKAQQSGACSYSLRTIILFMSLLAISGVFICAVLMPNEADSGPSTNSLTIKNELMIAKKTINDKINEWLPVSNPELHPIDHIDPVPDWDVEVWTPIDIDVHEGDPMVILCKLNFQSYSKNPHNTPMFRDLEGMSRCSGGNRRREKMSVLLADIKANEGNSAGRVIQPTGFVFHESRVGSTLVANLLASDPFALVFSESTPIANAILHCTECTRETQIQMFRNVLTLMGRSPIHNKLYVKFQSITTTKIEIALEAFPETSWAFVFRKPVQTMMSHLDPKKGASSAPCLRSKRQPPPDVMNAMKQYPEGRNANEAWCAAHLNMLCSMALRAYAQYNSTSSGRPRALLINYESLPGIVSKVLFPMFGQTVSPTLLTKMQEESKHYSKSRGSVFRLFFGDSKDKDERATDAIQQYSESILFPSYQRLNNLAKESLLRTATHANQDIISSDSFDWKRIQKLEADEIIGEIPSKLSTSMTAVISDKQGSSDEEGDPNPSHSHVLTEKEFLPWAPFANHHSSKPFEVIDCPLHPPPGYPKQYSMIDVTNNWNTDNTEIPRNHYDSICHFNYNNATQLQQAYNYRDKEVPFILYGIPELDEVVKKWNNLEYLSKLLGKKMYRTEASHNNHFMYWRGTSGGGKSLRGGSKQKWKPPTSIINTRFEDWLELAVKGQNKTLEDRTHQYFRVSSDIGNEWLSDELPFFKPKKSVFLVNPKEQHGIHCRFGMRSVIAEAHFDGSRNSVVEIGGLRRWILTHPDQCKNMHMLPPSHPSGRHSEVDWSSPDLERFPNFAKVMGNEVILQPGDFLFVPTYWIHYIVSLNVNFQCNSRSGTFQGYNKYIRECGF